MASWQRSRRIGGTPISVPPRHDPPRRSTKLSKAADGILAGTRTPTTKRSGTSKQCCVTFRRLPSGEWGLSGPRTVLAEGRRVKVKVKDGRVVTQRVGQLVEVGEGWVVAKIAA